MMSLAETELMFRAGAISKEVRDTIFALYDERAKSGVTKDDVKGFIKEAVDAAFEAFLERPINSPSPYVPRERQAGVALLDAEKLAKSEQYTKQALDIVESFMRDGIEITEGETVPLDVDGGRVVLYHIGPEILQLARERVFGGDGGS